MSDFFVEGAFILAGLGFWLFLALLAGLATHRFRAGARYFLKRAVAQGAVTATLMMLVFIFMPDIRLPGPGNIAAIAAMFFAGFAVAVLILLALRLIRH
ncbi:MAG: hypothetical protein ABI771_15255 [Betaproteobacteria bacterium]